MLLLRGARPHISFMGSSRTPLAGISAVTHGERESGLLERQRAEVDHRELDYCRDVAESRESTFRSAGRR